MLLRQLTWRTVDEVDEFHRAVTVDIIHPLVPLTLTERRVYCIACLKTRCMLPLEPLEALNSEQYHENCYLLCRLRVLPQPCLREACDLIKPIIHARYLLYPSSRVNTEEPGHVCCVCVSGKCELRCINFANRNSKNADSNLRQIHYCYC